MYETHWGLRESPFRALADPRFFYCSPTHEEALARLQFLVDNRRPLGLLLGTGGSGKTLVLEVFAQQLKAAGCQVASLNLQSLDSYEFLWELATQLGRNPPANNTPFQLWRSIADRFIENRYQQLSTIVLLDDADDVSSEVRHHVTRLLRHDASPDAPVTVVMAANPDRLKRIGPRLLELAELRIELETWDPDDIWQFLQASLALAGTDQIVFDPRTVARLHELTRGIPRRISHLAELALLAGAGRQLPQIDAATIDSVYEELCAAQ